MVRFDILRSCFDSLHVNKSDGVRSEGTDLIKIVIGGIGVKMYLFGCNLNDNGCWLHIGTNLIKIERFVENCEV